MESKRFRWVWIKSTIYFHLGGICYLSFFCESVVGKLLCLRSCISGIFSASFLVLFSKNTVTLCFENTFPVLFQFFPYIPQKQRLKKKKITKQTILYFLRSFFNMTAEFFWKGRVWFCSDHEKLFRAWWNPRKSPKVLMGAILNVISSSNREA